MSTKVLGIINIIIVHQDKSTVVAASILHNMISPNGASSNDDVIVTDIGTGNNVALITRWNQLQKPRRTHASASSLILTRYILCFAVHDKISSWNVSCWQLDCPISAVHCGEWFFNQSHASSEYRYPLSTLLCADVNITSENISYDSIYLTTVFTGNAACYLAALQSKEGSVLAFGPQPDATEKLLAKSDTLNASNVHIVNEPFLQSSCKDKIFKGVRGILCNPPSSLSGVVDIVGKYFLIVLL